VSCDCASYVTFDKETKNEDKAVVFSRVVYRGKKWKEEPLFALYERSANKASVNWKNRIASVNPCLMC
jgi:hypothetical protein